MCGIAGISDLRTAPDESVLRHMSIALERRGPDDLGLHATEHTGLVHRRLSIIDLAGGHQPIFNEDRTLAIVCNGEVYDFAELRNELQAKGHRFTTGSDTEVILHLYEDVGRDCVQHLNGMFAFAICHLASGDVFLARDRFGQKPLFYATEGGRLAFASGPQALRAVDWVDDSLDLTAIHDYLEYQYVPTPRTVFCGVRKLPAGSSAWWHGGALQIERYWKPQVVTDYTGSYADAQAELKELLAGAVKRRLVADVPLGLYLSGGLDSSLITALASEVTPAAKTFSIGFPEKKYDERRYSEMVAEHLGTEHHFLEVRPDDFSRLSELVSFYEEPFSDASMLPSCLLAEFTRQQVTVALTGDAADELFGGYYRYRIMHLLRLLSLCPQALRGPVCRALLKVLPPKTEERTFWGKLRRLVEVSAVDDLERYLAVISRFPHSLRQQVYGPALTEATVGYDGLSVLMPHFQARPLLVDGIMEMELNSYLVDDILVKVDRASMAYGLELRSPFLDVNVAEFAMRLPYHWKQQGAQRKRILVDTFADRLPSAIFTRPKMGFGVPIARWFRDGWQAPARELMCDGQLVKEGLFSRDGVAALFDEHVAMRADRSYPLFAMLILELWLANVRA